MVFNEGKTRGKTRIVHLDEGCDFLGFNVRRQSGNLLIKPSKAAMRQIRQRLRTPRRARQRGANVAMLLKLLTPIVRGWAAYYRTGPRTHHIDQFRASSMSIIGAKERNNLSIGSEDVQGRRPEVGTGTERTPSASDYDRSNRIITVEAKGGFDDLVFVTLPMGVDGFNWSRSNMVTIPIPPMCSLLTTVLPSGSAFNVQAPVD